MLLIYNLFVFFYRLFIHLAAAAGNSKATEWIEGRRNFFQNLNNRLNPNDSYIWFHCASAGELEQGKPLIERIKGAYPQYKVLISFFSPSGYKAGKKYPAADVICYLPPDTKQQAVQFIDAVHPKLVVFVKYEYWYHHLNTIYENRIPLLLVSAIFRKGQVFFKWYGPFYKKLLHFFSWIFVQDESSCLLLKENGIDKCSIAGDTRFDRVAAIAETAAEVPFIKEFIGNKKAIVAGSTWPADENILRGITEIQDIKIIIAPHEVNREHIFELTKRFPHHYLYSFLEQSNNVFPMPETATPARIKLDKQQADGLNQQSISSIPVLIIDSLGLLSRLYQYATICYIGGGFNKSGIHNTLEAAVWGRPVIFGPNYHKFKEARDLISAKGAFSISNAEATKEVLQSLLYNDVSIINSSQAAKEYVQQNRGATEKILHYIQENRLLTN